MQPFVDGIAELIDGEWTQHRRQAVAPQQLHEVHVNLGNLWFRVPGRIDEAIAEYEKALSLNPGDADAHYDLACGLARISGRLQDAIVEYEDAVRLRPEFAAAHVNLGNALLKVPGRSNDAIVHFEEAIHLRPDLAEAHFSLAMALLDMPGRGDEGGAGDRPTLAALGRIRRTGACWRRRNGLVPPGADPLLVAQSAE